MRPILACCLLLLLASCPAKSQLSARHDLVTDDLGVGIRLMMDLDAANGAAAAEGVVTKVLSADDKHEITGFKPESETDEVVAIYYSADPTDDSDPLGNRISDIRCFINTGSSSPLRLLGERIAQMGADEVEQLLGEPLSRSEDAGQIHLTYLFDPEIENAGLQLRLVTSHHLDRSCYAFRLALEPRQ